MCGRRIEHAGEHLHPPAVVDVGDSGARRGDSSESRRDESLTMRHRSTLSEPAAPERVITASVPARQNSYRIHASTRPTVRMAGFATMPDRVRGRLKGWRRAYHPAVADPHIVVVEDDEGIGASLARTLTSQGYHVDWARSGSEAMTAVRATTALVILDLGLPDQDGLEVCRALRAGFPSTQVLMLTARSEEADIVLGLDAGADDYLSKPFRLAELLARVRACTRRVESDRDHLVVGGITIDVDARRVAVDGEAVEFRPKEFDLLVALARSAGRVVTRDQLLADVWDEHWFGSTKTLDIHIWAVRRKLDRSGEPSRISTVRGVGYRMELP